jgi:hypothetical protein
MFTIKRSRAACAVLVIVVGMGTFAAVMPIVSWAQGRSRIAPPLCDLRKFYLTQTEHSGNEALTACTQGYHMASLWEIFNPSSLKYDTALGFTEADSGYGLPLVSGWIRTGQFSSESDNCSAWTTDSATQSGRVIRPEDANNWENTPAQVTAPWESGRRTCDTRRKVWCVQD